MTPQHVCLCAALLLFHGVVQAQTLQPGLIGEYYWLGQSVADFPVIERGDKPNMKRIDDRIDFTNGLGNIAGTPWKDHVYIRWSGKLRVTTADTYTFTLNSDDGSRLYIYDRLVVDNGGLHALTNRSGSVDLPPGDHDIRVEYFENASAAGCQLAWESPNRTREILSTNTLFHVEPVTPSRESARLQLGLEGNYYTLAGMAKEMPVYELDEPPTFKRIDDQINFPQVMNGLFGGTDLYHQFYVRWTGKIRIPADGMYAFSVESDDGSRLFINDKIVVDNSNDHPMKELEAEVELKAGDHDLLLEYFQGGGASGCLFRWKMPGGDKEIVPVSVLAH